MRRDKLTERAWPVIGLTTAAVFICFCIAWGNAGQAAGQDAAAVDPVLAQEQEDMQRQILKIATQAFDPSLETKENVDFLLTPALLVQEAMSRGTVVTYPGE